MRAPVSLYGVCVAALLLCGCNEAQPVAAVPPPPAAPAAKFANLPAGAACTEKIHRYQSVLAADLSTGNVEQKVYDQIEQELAQAAADCADGLGREALSLVHASEVRHGYHV
ncbi:MAG: hypothetical protein WCF20_10605 [Methylovirgula sp.]